jgi:TIR domain
MSYIFISHSHNDNSFVKKLASDLRIAGHNVWVDIAVLNVGDSLIRNIRPAIDQVDYVIAVLSKSTIDSEWVNRELEIASTREIEEKKVIVIPLILEIVDLPGFLKGKYYADFTNPDSYKESLDSVLKAIGGSKDMPNVSPDEILRLKAELESAKALIDTHKKEINIHRKLAYRGKSKELITAIENADKHYPLYTPINATYAFLLGGIPVTLDYLLFAISKARREGSHIIEVALSIHKQWDDAYAMIEAYKDLLDTIESNE